MIPQEYVDKWERSGLLQGLSNHNKTMLTITLETISEEVILFKPRYNEIVNLIFPIARKLTETNFHPEPTWLCRDFGNWFL